VAFVGRLRSDTTEKDLTDWLAEGGIHDVKCRKLKAKEGRTLKQQLFGLHVIRNMKLCFMMNQFGQLGVSFVIGFLRITCLLLYNV
jgi:hypothetical protein